MNADPYRLQRFLDAQASVYPQVYAELAAGRKQTHWMWFIFPQIAGLGTSAMARVFAIASRAEAVAYAEHPMLGARLRECTALVNRSEAGSAEAIFGSLDAMKFRSSMTLFSMTARNNELFKEALGRFFAGAMDPSTLARL